MLFTDILFLLEAAALVEQNRIEVNKKITVKHKAVVLKSLIFIFIPPIFICDNVTLILLDKFFISKITKM